jgi:hypothetical protein
MVIKYSLNFNTSLVDLIYHNEVSSFSNINDNRIINVPERSSYSTGHLYETFNFRKLRTNLYEYLLGMGLGTMDKSNIGIGKLS